MFIEEIIVADVAAIVLLIILLITRHMTRRAPRLEDRIFTYFIIIGIVSPLLEMASFLVDGRADPFLRVFNIIVNIILYTCTATV